MKKLPWKKEDVILCRPARREPPPVLPLAIAGLYRKAALEDGGSIVLLMKRFKFPSPAITGLLYAVIFCSAASASEVRVRMERDPAGGSFQFGRVPPPARNDAAASARFEIVTGGRDRNAAELDVLHDGRVPQDEDQPSANFFFAGDGGRLRLDLGSIIPVKNVATYSWHPGGRGPQVYVLYGSDGMGAGFNPAPGEGVDPVTCGWERLARVDTRPSGDRPEEPGGQYGVLIEADADAENLGRFRYLLFEVFKTDERDPFGNTFFSEIDVLHAGHPEPERHRPEQITVQFASADGRYHWTIDATAAPDLVEWSRERLRPVIEEWYPRLVELLPSPGFQPPANVVFRYRHDMGGTPASAGGNRVNLNTRWFRGELQREALGAVVHEMVHVVQSYGRARRREPGFTRTPGWLVEGIADYIRWFLYEPETRGAEITERNFDRARHDASYRITGNFLNWVTERHDPEIVPVLNAAAREARYSESIWKERTGLSLEELGEAWRREHAERLGVK